MFKIRSINATRPFNQRKRSGLMSAPLAFLPLMMMPGVAIAAEEQPDAPVFTGADIIVTAQKREQRIQDVPATIQAFNQEKIDAAGVTSLEDLPALTPGLTIPRLGGGPIPFIRGIGAAQVGGGQEAAVATYVDGIYYVDGFSITLDTANIDRIEVLKGPQGTLSGRNATGGVLNVITRDPEQDLSGSASAYIGNFERYGGDFYITGGLSDTLSANLALAVRRQDKGFGRNLFDKPVNGSKINYRELFSGRAKLKWEQGETMVVASFDYTDRFDDGGNAATIFPGSLGLDGQLIFGGCLAGGESAAQCTQTAIAGATRKTGGFYDINSDFTGQNDLESFGGSLRITHDFGAFTLLSLTGYRHDDIRQPLDNDFTPLPIVTGSPFVYYNRSFTQEFQLTSNNSGPFKWIAGAFYLHARGGADILLRGLALAGPIEGLAPFGLESQRLAGEIVTDSYAVFGDVTYEPAPGLALTLGGRFTRDERAVAGATTLTPFADAAQSAGGTPVALPAEQEKTFEKFTWRAVAAYEISPQANVYASFNRGFKSGNFNALDATQPAVEPESIDAYEAGLKSQWFDRKLTFNLAGFYYDYSNLQLLVAQGNGATLIQNAAKAKIKGIEAEISANPADGMTLYASGARTWAKYTSYPDAAIYVPTGFGGNTLIIADLSGNRVAKTPKFTGNIGARWAIQTPVGEITPAANVAYSSGFPWDSDERLRQKAYTLVNASIDWSLFESDWTLRLDVKNLTKTRYCVFCTATGTGDIFAAAQPRTVTASVEYTF